MPSWWIPRPAGPPETTGRDLRPNTAAQNVSVDAERLQIVLPRKGKCHRSVGCDNQALTVGSMYGKCRFTVHFHLFDIRDLTDPKPGKVMRGYFHQCPSFAVHFGIVTGLIHGFIFQAVSTP